MGTKTIIICKYLFIDKTVGKGFCNTYKIVIDLHFEENIKK